MYLSQQRLVVLARELDNDVLNGLLKCRVVDQSYIEAAGLLQPMCFSNDHNRALLERRHNASYGID